MKYSTHLSGNHQKRKLFPEHYFYSFILLIMFSLSVHGQSFYHSTTTPKLCNGGLNTLTNEYEICWPPVSGADEYQLEWVHINNYNGMDLDYDFKNNSTRITTTETSYNITSLFEKGYLLFRVRAIKYNDPEKTQIIASQWSNEDKGKVSTYNQNQKQEITSDNIHAVDDMNWQYIANYAEGGKKKEVVTYYDGTMRSHQMVTRINTDSKSAIVGETMYDHQGRGALQTLPAPAQESILKYYKSFNLNNQGSVYSREDFDLSTADPCSVQAGMMNPLSGSSHYYSPNYLEDGTNHKNHDHFIPDAGGYPFSHTEYEPDNTGRIRRQGGVGPQYQLGNLPDYHPTTYLYDKPSQEKLDRMFGSDAGYNSHYKEIVTQDANGQLNISYLDMQGRVVATSLSGNAATGLQELESNKSPQPFEINVIDNQPIGTGGSQYTSVYYHSVTNKGDHTFTYELPSSTFSTATQSGKVCLDCVYDITIDIKDECGTNPTITGDYNSLPIKETIGTFNDICGSSQQGLNITFTAQDLPEGKKYTITRTLSVNPESYKQNLYQKNYGQETLEEVIRKKISELDLVSACAPLDCRQECLKKGGDDVEDCILECEYPDYYQALSSTLSSDFIPGLKDAGAYTVDPPLNGGAKPTAGGQYALYTISEQIKEENGETIYEYTYSSEDETSIFHFNNFGNILTYLKGLYPSDHILHTLHNDSESVKKYIESFQPEWADKLASSFHPERKCLADKQNTDTRESLKYDFLMRSTETYEEAYALGLLNPLGNASSAGMGNLTINKIDPFFNTPSRYNAMNAAMRAEKNFSSGAKNVGLNLWEQAIVAITKEETTPNYNLILSQTNECNRDRIWQVFRALYLDLKNKYEDTETCTTCYKFYDGTDQPCSQIGGNTNDPGNFYKDKIRRVQNLSELYSDEDTDLLNSIADGTADGAALEALGKSKQAAACESQASAQVDDVLSKISGCIKIDSITGTHWDETVPQYNDLRVAFIEIMKQACISTHSTLGASSLPPDVTVTTPRGTFTSFTDAMEKILDVTNLDITCNPDLISYPKKANHEYTAFTHVKVIDECGCNQLVEYYNKYNALTTKPAGINSAQKYFEHETGFSVDNYLAKICLCEQASGQLRKTWNKNHTWTPTQQQILADSHEYVPAELDCQICTDCQKIEEVLVEFSQQYWVQKLNYGSFFRTNIGNHYLRQMRTNYLNNKLNQNKTYDQYDEFIAKCQATNTAPICEITPAALQLQSFMNSIVKKWRITDCNSDPSVMSEARKLLQYTNPTQCDYTTCLYDPIRTSGNTLEMSIKTQGCNNLDCRTTLSFEDETKGYQYENIIPFFENIRFAPGSGASPTTNEFYIDAQVVYQNKVITTTMKGVVCFPIAKCYNSNNHDITLCEERPKPIMDECGKLEIKRAVDNTTKLYTVYMDSVVTALSAQYTSNCLANTRDEKFRMKYTDNEHHFTLYYYDQAGNLVKTIPPEGVELITDPGLLAQIEKDRNSGKHTTVPNHRMATHYQYNSLNQLVAQYMPDHDAFEVKSIDQANGLPNHMDITSTLFADDNNGILFGIDPSDPTKSLIYTTSNGGKDWYIQKATGLKNLNAVCKVPGINTLYAVGDAGTIAVAENGGDWMMLPVSNMPDLIGIHMTDANNGYIFAKNGQIYQKMNGGTWTFLKHIDNQVTLQKIYFRDNNNGIAVGFDNTLGRGVIYETTGNGTWVKQDQIALPVVSALHMFSATNGYAFCSDGLILHTGDGGDTWQQTTHMPNPVHLAKVHFFTQNEGIAIDQNNRLLATNNGGYSWTPTNLANANISITTFAMNPNIGKMYAVSREGATNKLYKMGNNANSWIPVLKIPSATHATIQGSKITGLYFNTTTGYATNYDGSMLETADAGNNWTAMPANYNVGYGNTILHIYENNNTLRIITPYNSYSYYQMYYGWVFNSGSNGGNTYSSYASVPNTNFSVVATSNGIHKTNNNTLPLIAAKISPAPLRNVYSQENLSVAVGDNGTILYKYTYNSTSKWTMVGTPFNEDLLSVCIPTTGPTLVGTSKGNLYQNNSISSGNPEWNKIELTPNNPITDIDYSTTQQVSFIGTASGHIYKQQNTSGTYTNTPIYYGTGKRINDLLVYNGNAAVTAGNQGDILAAKYPGSWVSQSDMKANPLIKDAARADDGTLYSITYSTDQGYVIRNSTDNGVSWPSDKNSDYELKAIAAAGENNVVAVGVGAIYQKTSSGWTTINASGKILNDVCMTSSGIYYAVGNNGTIISSVTGQTIKGNVSTNLNGVYFIKGTTTGFIVGDNGLILKTTDGKTWDIMKTTPDTESINSAMRTNWVAYLQNNPGNTTSLRSICAQDESTLYASGNGGVLLKSTDGGVTWSIRESETTKDLTQVQAKKDGTLILSGNKSALLQYKDGTDNYSMRFYYDPVGRLIASQNSKQQAMKPKRYSYTRYDKLGRVIEAGEVALTTIDEWNELLVKTADFPQELTTVPRYQVTRTLYDKPISNEIKDLFSNKLLYLRNRVASVTYQETYSPSSTTYNHATHYCYDIHGNVKELIQDNPDLKQLGQQHKKIQYDYDLISGNVNKVSYQPGKPDQFYHKYEYDADNRIMKAYTSTDNTNWDNDASYQYYKHGPLARTELGQQKVQGIDYAYTLQGWIKGVNSNVLGTDKDMGNDGNNGFAKDAFGYSLHYNANDYKAIGGPASFLSAVSQSNTDGFNSAELFNGNISKMVTALKPTTGYSGIWTEVLGKTYTYDELNRLVASNTFEGNDLTTTSKYNTSYEYDANGNIKKLNRNGDKTNNLAMDHLIYRYTQDSNGKKLNNRLLHVNDLVTTHVYNDITDQDIPGKPYVQNDLNSQNYKYDKIGNLIADKQEEIANIEWNVQGKVEKITRTTNSTKSDLLFKYDAMGNRISKIEKLKTPLPDGTMELTTYYVRDASGNVMAVYEKMKQPASLDIFKLKEQHIYGSSRLGLRQSDVKLVTRSGNMISTHTNIDFTNSKRFYELSNHLGNVLAVVSDKKILNADGTYSANVVSASDFYPFGSQMPGRTISNPSDSYRYGFGSHEKIDEVSGNGNTLDMGDRWLDVRLGRTSKMDRYATKYPSISSYSYAANNPIFFIDPDGKVIRASDATTQGYVLQYITEQLGENHGYSFNSENTLISNATGAEKNYNKQHKSINKVIIKVINARRIVDVEISENQRTFEVPIRRGSELQTDSEGKIILGENGLPKLGGELRVVADETVNVERTGGALFYVNKADESNPSVGYLKMNTELSCDTEFETESGIPTGKDDASSVFIHELLDHGLDFIKTGNIDKSGTNSKKNVNYQNKSLENLGSEKRSSHYD